MVLRIRLARFGTKRKPIYNIILAQAKSGRDKKPMEVLGTYNPIPQTPLATPDTPELLEDGTKFVPKKQKDVQLDLMRTRYWLGVGAQPTEPVEKLLRLVSHTIPITITSITKGNDLPCGTQKRRKGRHNP
ncbi:ribosomal protein S16 [Cladophialophora carrionii CBS 160.54]|nr:ribosomal protein S16 [Cladophialophora carrionii CBS 160.54]ETI23799.1 ribosomal protein S16 [Cladophialophora carrionii CBS 160.54]